MENNKELKNRIELTDDELWELSKEDRPITMEELGIKNIHEDGFYYIQII